MKRHWDHRTYPRIEVESLCTEVASDEEQYSMLVDLSENGVRLQRPFRRGSEDRIVQLEFELPEADEMIWAKGLIVFDQLWRVPASRGENAVRRVVRTSGVRVVAAASRHMRMLRDYVMAQEELRQEAIRSATLNRMLNDLTRRSREAFL